MKALRFEIVALTVALVGCQTSTRTILPADAEIVQKKVTAPLDPAGKYFLGQVQIQLSSPAELESFVLSMESHQGVSLKLLDQVPTRPIYLFEVSSPYDLDDVVTRAKQDARVTAASKSYRIGVERVRNQEAPVSERRLRFKTNDPLFSTQWALNNESQEAPSSLAGKYNADISMGGVDTAGSKDVVVAVIDTGLDYYHEDLAVVEMVDGKPVIKEGSNIWVNPGEIPADGINNDNNGDTRVGWGFIDDVHGYNFVGRNGDPMDDHGHGTHVAGVIGALRNNFKGIAGMNDKVSIMGLKFLSAEGGGSDFDAQMALYYLIDLKKRFPEKRFITSNSWGSAGRSSKNGDEDDFLLMAFAEADREGILNIAAAGNDGVSNKYSEHFPSNYSNKLPAFISVAATNNRDQMASFSNYGFGLVQVAAPGVQIMSTVPAFLFGGNGYASWSGTSMATPHVTGLAALLWGQNLNASSRDVKDRILNSVDVLPQLHGNVTTAGRINVARALGGDLNASLMPVPDEMDYRFESPRGNDAKTFDWISTIKIDGAREIAVCFSRIDLDADSDWLEVLAKDYRVKDMMTGKYRDKNYKNESRELCSAPVLGDTVHLRLSNQGATGGLQGFETSYLKVVK